MTVHTFTEERKIALEKWREYKAAEKQSSNPLYKDLKKVYNQIKGGRKIIDIFQAIKQGGIHSNHHPKLAVAMATSKKIECCYYQNGNVHYNNPGINWKIREHKDVQLNACLPEYKFQTTGNGIESWRHLRLEAPVPLIPPKHLPKVLTDDYYILWEVDEWKMVPPTDPWLLRRITKTLFVVLAGWDLTEIEKSVMQARL